MTKKNLVIVESPAKARTIGKILGDNFVVVSSLGHLIDLPTKELGVEIEKDFKPHFIVMSNRKKVVSELKKEAKGKDNIYVATDPDREGEAIGWHIKDKVLKGGKISRVFFHEITDSAVKGAFHKPRDFDLKMVEAQIGRRVLDRLVGYFLSPLLWKKIARGLSAGRVQSVALRLIVDREREIANFIPQEYWEIEIELSKHGKDAHFKAKLEKINGEKLQIKDKQQAEALAGDIKEKQFIVSDIKKSIKKRNPAPPFITSTLQQDAFNKLRFNASKTMLIAQQLYEGIDTGKDSPVGFITYMRTDSTNIAQEAVNKARDFILKKFGKEYLPEKPPVYKSKKFAQEAHEAIRPTSVDRQPENVKQHLNSDQYKLYELIYNRFIASQMTAANFSVTTVDINAEKYLFTASGSTLVFKGFLAIYNVEDEENDKEKNTIPDLEKNELLDLIKLVPSQHFTKPPPRYSDSSLVKTLEEDGIGRPSTYAPIIYTLIMRDYVRRIKRYFHATELGSKVCDLLVNYFPTIMDIKFTAAMEEELDEIEEGRIDKLKVLQDFYAPFKTSLDFAQKNIKKEVVQTSEICDKCGKPMIIKWGRKGKFLSCSDYPNCKNSKSITTKIKCPSGCGGELIERRSKRGFFYGCTNYPKCTYITKDLPEENQDDGQVH